MGPITYALCQKPVIGLMMWATSLCQFPPLISNTPFSVTEINNTVIKSFEVPVDKRYTLKMDFDFVSRDAYKADLNIGTRSHQHCFDETPYQEIPRSERKGLGQPLDFKLTIKDKNQKVVIKKSFSSLCISSYRPPIKRRTLTHVNLTEGSYTLELTTLSKYENFQEVNSSLILDAGRWMK